MNIKEKILESGYNDRQIADATNGAISLQAIYRIRLGRTKEPNQTTITAIEKAIEVLGKADIIAELEQLEKDLKAIEPREEIKENLNNARKLLLDSINKLKK